MEKRFVTQSFPFRLFTTMLGKCFVDTYDLHVYINKDNELEFKPACRRMFFALLHNNYDEIQNGDCDPNVVFDAAASPYEDARPSEGASSSTCSGLGHLPVRLQDIPGYDGSAQQWCVVCGMKVTFCCAACSNKDYIVAIHPRQNKGKCYTCLDEHAADPSAHVGVRPQAKQAKKKKRGEGQPDSPAKNTRQRSSTRAPRTSSAKRPAPRRRAESDSDDDDAEDDDDEGEEEQDEDEDEGSDDG
eukprot:5324272-Prymnesium_polylepis.1